MSGQSGGSKVRLADLNEQLTCKLCGGYFRDATTIKECFHSFCKACIVKYLENNKYCPVCKTQVHKNKPLLSIRSDSILQDIVYKVVPGYYQNEIRNHQEYLIKHPTPKNLVNSPETIDPVENRIYSPDELISLSLHFYDSDLPQKSKDEDKPAKALRTRYLRCPAAVTIQHLQKLIRAKNGLTNAHRVDIMFKDEPLSSTYTLMDIMYIFHWRKKVPLRLSYRVFNSASKRIKLSDDNEDFKLSLNDCGIDLMDSIENSDSTKKEWKEVQLKISESGVMSVTDISILDDKKNSNTDLGTSHKENTENNSSQETDSSLNSQTNEDNNLKPKASDDTKETNQSKDAKNDHLSTLCEETASHTQTVGSERMEIKSIEQHDLSKELLGTKEFREPETSDSTKSSTNCDSGQISNKQDILNNISECSSESKDSVKQKNKINDDKNSSTCAGSKINALSAKLQVQPKQACTSDSDLKKLSNEHKSYHTSKIFETKPGKSHKADKTVIPINTNVNSTPQNTPSKILTDSKEVSLNTPMKHCSNIPHSSNASLEHNKQTCSSIHSIKKSSTENLVDNPSTETLASVGLHTSTSVANKSQTISLSLASDQQINNVNKSSSKNGSDQKIGTTLIDKNITIPTNTTSTTCAGRFDIQTPSMSIFPTTTKGGISPSVKVTPKTNVETPNITQVPPCPGAIPISMMKPIRKQDSTSTAKGNVLNEICAKIGSPGAGSKINDICAKIGENSKEKKTIDNSKQMKSDIPDLLKISSKNPIHPDCTVKAIPNIPNIPTFTPSGNFSNTENKDTRRTSVAYSHPGSLNTSNVQKLSVQKKNSQAVGYKTLHHPPKTWNPTLSKNDYVAIKNQTKEMQNRGSFSLDTGIKQMPSKPEKIYKVRTTPRVLGNPALGVKPMYGVVNETKDKDLIKTTAISKTPSMSITKIDPQTLSPIVSSNNSPIVSPPPYSPTARSYQNTPFNRDICRNSSSPISSRNSPVNMLTNPFIPSVIPNTNLRSPMMYMPFLPPFSDSDQTQRLHYMHSNSLIRSSIGIHSPSAYHNSLPQSINKTYQRSTYASQNSNNYTSSTSHPSVQRIPATGHSSPTSKSPKNSSHSPTLLNNMRSDSINTNSVQSISSSSHLHLSKNPTQRDLSAFDLRKSENHSLTQKHTSKKSITSNFNHSGQDIKIKSVTNPEVIDNDGLIKEVNIEKKSEKKLEQSKEYKNLLTVNGNMTSKTSNNEQKNNIRTHQSSSSHEKISIETKKQEAKTETPNLSKTEACKIGELNTTSDQENNKNTKSDRSQKEKVDSNKCTIMFVD